MSFAKGLAEARKISLGAAVSYLARRGATARAAFKVRNGFHVFTLEKETPPFGPDEVRAALEAEDQDWGASFWKPGR